MPASRLVAMISRQSEQMHAAGSAEKAIGRDHHRRLGEHGGVGELPGPSYSAKLDELLISSTTLEGFAASANG